MTSFIHSFARKSKICHILEPNPTEELKIKKKTLNLAPQNSQKYAILRSQNKKFAPSQTPPPVGRGCSWWGEEHPVLHSTPSALRPPNFELALTPLAETTDDWIQHRTEICQRRNVCVPHMVLSTDRRWHQAYSNGN